MSSNCGSPESTVHLQPSVIPHFHKLALALERIRQREEQKSKESDAGSRQESK